jgi:hypothetical protein
MGYFLEGDLLEVCTCNVLCPCWIGEDPDNGSCDTALAYHIRSGGIDGIDVAGLTVASTAHIPGNVLAGGYRQRLYIDGRADDAQAEALTEALLGRRGGVLADIAALVGENLGVERVAIEYALEKGRGRFAIAGTLEAVMEPYRGPSGKVTTLHETIFSTIPGSPAYVARAERFRLAEPALGIDIDLSGHNAIQGSFRFRHDGDGGDGGGGAA